MDNNEKIIKYNIAKQKVREELIAKKQWRCFFSNKFLPFEFNEYHHLFGRDGDLFFTESNIRPALRKYHTEYHQLNISQLIKTEWYLSFLKRIKIDFYPLFLKELKKFDKGNIDLEILNNLNM